MGIQNYGNQTISIGFNMQAKAVLFNKLLYGFVPHGIYEGGTLTKISNNEVEISPFVIFYSDNNNSVVARIKTYPHIESSSVPRLRISGVTNANPYIVLYYEWVESQNNYADIGAVSLATLIDSGQTLKQNYIIFGKAIYDGSTLTGFDYNLRTNNFYNELQENNNSFFISTIFSGTEPRRVYVNSGTAIINGKYVSYSGGNSPLIDSVTSNYQRIDLVYLKIDGTIQIQKGVEHLTTPVIPYYPSDGLVLAKLTLDDSTTIQGQMIEQIKADRESYTGFYNSTSLIDADLHVTGNTTLDGNLTVLGTTTTIHTQDLDVEDNIIKLNSGFTGVPPSTLQTGIEIERGDSPNMFLLYDELDGLWKNGLYASMKRMGNIEDSPLDTGIAFWNVTDQMYKTSANLTYDYSGNKVWLKNSASLEVETGSFTARKNVYLAYDYDGSNIYCRGDLIVQTNTPSTRFSVNRTTGNAYIYGTLQIDNTLTVTNPYEINYKNETLDARFVNVTGDTMTGALIIGNNLTVNPGYNITYRGLTLQDQFFELTTDNTISATNIWSGINTFTGNVVLNASTGTTTYKGIELDTRYINATFELGDSMIGPLTMGNVINMSTNSINGYGGESMLVGNDSGFIVLNESGAFSKVVINNSGSPTGNPAFLHIGSSERGNIVIGDIDNNNIGFQYRRSSSTTTVAKIDGNRLVTMSSPSALTPYVLNQALNTDSTVTFDTVIASSYRTTIFENRYGEVTLSDSSFNSGETIGTIPLSNSSETVYLTISLIPNGAQPSSSIAIINISQSDLPSIPYSKLKYISLKSLNITSGSGIQNISIYFRYSGKNVGLWKFLSINNSNRYENASCNPIVLSLSPSNGTDYYLNG
jgi:hypothetical protein